MAHESKRGSGWCAVLAWMRALPTGLPRALRAQAYNALPVAGVRSRSKLNPKILLRTLRFKGHGFLRFGIHDPARDHRWQSSSQEKRPRKRKKNVLVGTSKVAAASRSSDGGNACSEKDNTQAA